MRFCGSCGSGLDTEALQTAARGGILVGEAGTCIAADPA